MIFVYHYIAEVSVVNTDDKNINFQGLELALTIIYYNPVYSPCERWQLLSHC